MRFPNLHAGQLHDLQRRQDALRLSPSARQRLEWLIYLSEHRHSISSACRHFGIARTTLHRWVERFNPHDPFTLEERSHHPMQRYMGAQQSVLVSPQPYGYVPVPAAYGTVPMYGFSDQSQNHVSPQPDTTNHQAVPSAPAAAPQEQHAPCTCFFCRLRSKRPWFSGVFLVSLFLNLAVIALLVFSVFSDWNAGRVQATESPLPAGFLLQPSRHDAP